MQTKDSKILCTFNSFTICMLNRPFCVLPSLTCFAGYLLLITFPNLFAKIGLNEEKKNHNSVLLRSELVFRKRENMRIGPRAEWNIASLERILSN